MTHHNLSSRDAPDFILTRLAQVQDDDPVYRQPQRMPTGTEFSLTYPPKYAGLSELTVT